MTESAQILSSYEKIRQRVERFPGARLVAVSKFQSVEKIKILVDAGQLDFGENYLQEWQDKRDLLPHQLRWHFIGQLQSRKLKDLMANHPIYSIHSIGSLSALAKLKNMGELPSGGCFLQINLAGEAQKGGLSLTELEVAEAEFGLKKLIRGLMTIPPITYQGETLRQHFKTMKKLNDQWGFAELSMGMSDDWEMALEEGATYIRIGSAIFGARPSS